MKILDSLIKVAEYRREEAEHRRAMLMARMERLRQSKQLVNEDLKRLQEKYQATQTEQSALAPVQLITLRQLWIEAQERQQLMKSLDEQLESMEKDRQAINKELKAAWAKEQSLQRARELALERKHAEALRVSYLVADDNWSQTRPVFSGVRL